MTTTTRTRLLIVAAGTALLIGLLAGVAPISAHGVSCGSAFVASDGADIADLRDTFSGGRLRTGQIGGVAAACDDRRSARQLPAVALLVLAGGLGVGAMVSRGAASSARTGSHTPDPHRPAGHPPSETPTSG